MGKNWKECLEEKVSFTNKIADKIKLPHLNKHLK